MVVLVGLSTDKNSTWLLATENKDITLQLFNQESYRLLADTNVYL